MNPLSNEKKTLKILAICTAVLVIFVLFGAFRYYRLNTYSKQLKTDTDTKIGDLEGRLANTELENTSLSDALEAEREKNREFEEQVEKLVGKVDVLERLSETDPELLKKYSKVYFLNENYTPKKLIDISEKYLWNSAEKEQVHVDVAPFLRRMLDRAARAKVDLKVVSAYRSFGEQASIKSQYKIIYGAGTANQFSAEQGFSEHQLGTAIDFSTGSKNGSLDISFETTPEFKWLQDNAYRYGFVLSYPRGNTYYQYEPWHWRFVGTALAEKLDDEDMNFYDMDQREIDSYLVNIFE